MFGKQHALHEVFLREYLNNGFNGKAAYIQTFGPCKTANVQACKMLKRPYVQRKYKQMISKIIKRSDITEEKILGKYEEAFEMAKDSGKTADMISAASAQAKLVGLLRERLETGAPGEFEHLENISDVLESLAAQVGPELASKLADAFGLVKQIESQSEDETSPLAETQPASDAIN